MSTLLQLGITNALVATLLAVLVGCLTWRLRNPMIVHILWLVVLLKLLAPPLVHLPFPQFAAPGKLVGSAEPGISMERRLDASGPSPGSDPVEPETSRPRPVPSAEPPAIDGEPRAGDAVAARPPRKIQVVEVASVWAVVAAVDWSVAIASLWLAGSGAILAISGGRIWRFHRVLRTTAEPSPDIRRMGRAVQAQMRVRSRVEVRLTAAAIPPLLWSLGRRHVILLPAALAEQLGEREMEAVLAHELAHVKRRDYLVRWVELAAVILYWWLPTVWWVRRQLREAEEVACDAWVIATLPGRRREYAEALVFAVEAVAAARPLPVIASGLGEGRRLIRRIERLADRPSPRPSRFRLCGIAGSALLVLPLSVNLFDAIAEEQTGSPNPADQGRADKASGDALADRPAPAAADDPQVAQRHAAIARGTAFLKGEQAAEGNWGDLIGFEGSMTALCTLALLDAGVPPTDESVARALTWLREHDKPEKTYVVSLVTRVYAAAGLPEDRGRIKRNADWLASTMIDAGDFRGCWGYTTKDETGDNSNAHYAILGLDAAESAGVEVPENIWRAALEYWISAQNADGSWGYKPRVHGTGSMTASGVTALAVILNRSDFTDRDDDRQGARAALDHGFAWLAKHYSITGNPVPAINRDWERWHYYYLDALAHGCRHADRAMIGDHDLAGEVTELLLKEQQPNGSWSGVVPEDNQMATAFALLVLALVGD